MHLCIVVLKDSTTVYKHNYCNHNYYDPIIVSIYKPFIARTMQYHCTQSSLLLMIYLVPKLLLITMSHLQLCIVGKIYNFELNSMIDLS